MSDDINMKVLGRDRSMPAAGPDGLQVPLRASRYGDAYTQPLPGERHALALEGSYFLFHNATNDAATTLAGHAAPVLVDADATMTKPFLHLMMPANSTKRAFLDWIEIEVITAGANGTADSWAAQLDTGATRVTAAGTALTKLSPNMQTTNQGDLVPQGGAITVGAEGVNVRNLGFGQFRPSIAIAGDKYLLQFGQEPRSSQGIATIAHHVLNLGPVQLGANDQFLFALYSPSQTAAGVYKVRGGWWER